MTFVVVFAGGIALEEVGPLIWIWFLAFCEYWRTEDQPLTDKMKAHLHSYMCTSVALRVSAILTLI
jgi:hypothetical protein